MRSLNKTILYSVLFMLMVGSAHQTFSQCSSFTKKQGLPALGDFLHNGQLTSTKFFPGDDADIEMMFNAGNDYRVLVVYQEVLGDVVFTIKDKMGKVLYVSNAGDKKPYWDFRVTATQQLVVHVQVPKSAELSNKILPQGCVSVLVGFRPSEKKSTIKTMR